MRILHLSTSEFGGAGKSAAILNNHLQEVGITSLLLTRHALGLPEKIKSKGITFLGRLTSTSEYDFLSSHSTSTLNFEALHRFEPQIIHVHNWYNLLSAGDFSRLAKIAPLVFTLHDERLATGGCHVTLNCKKFLAMCDDCPAHQLKLSREKFKKELEVFYTSGQQYSLISPSLWIMEKMRNTALVSNANLTAVIPNHISAMNSILPPLAPNSDSIELIFVASNLDVPYKGLKILLSAMSILDAKIKGLNKQINLTLVGTTRMKNLDDFANIRISFQEHTSTQVLMGLMRKAAILVVPSLSENYPGVIAEGQNQGTRVVAHRVGGIPEMIKDGVTGYLCEPTARSLSDKILEAILDSNAEQVRVNAFQEVLSRQGSEKVNESHIDFYEKLLLGTGA